MGEVRVLRRAPGRAPGRRRGSLGKTWVRFLVPLSHGIQVEVAARRGSGYLPWCVRRPDRVVWLHPGRSYGEVVSMKRKRQATEQVGGVASASPASKLLESVSSVVKHLTVRQYDDGAVRTPGTLLIKTVGSMWQLTAKDPDSCQQLIVLAATCDDALLMLSMLLEADDAPWEPDPWASQKAPKKSRK